MPIRCFVILLMAAIGFNSPVSAATAAVSPGISLQQDNSTARKAHFFEKWKTKAFKLPQEGDDKKRLTRWATWGAVFGFASLLGFIIAVSTFSYGLIISVFLLSLLGAVFSIVVIKDTKGKPEFRKLRKLAIASLVSSTLWLILLGAFWAFVLLTEDP